MTQRTASLSNRHGNTKRKYSLLRTPLVTYPNTMRPEIMSTVFGVCLLYFFQVVFTMKCWVCRSDLDPRCVDPFDNTTIPIFDCDTVKLEQYPDLKATMCRKIRQKVYGNWRFIRSCAFLGSPGEGTGNENYCTMRTGTYNVFMETCTCNSKDGCNGAATTQLSYAAIFTALLLLKTRLLQAG